MPGHRAESVKKRAKAKLSKDRAGLRFPVGRIDRILRKGNYARRIGRSSAVHLSAALEYLAAKILALAAKAATDIGRNRITPRHVMLAIKNDDELNKILKGVIISRGGVMPNIHQELLSKKTAKHSNISQSSAGSSRAH